MSSLSATEYESSPQESPTQVAEVRRGRWKSRLALAGVSLLVGTALVATLELGLRLLHIGDPYPPTASRLRYQHVVVPSFKTARRADGTAILRTADPRIASQSILRDKPSDGLRVFIFGASATAGLGFSVNVTFARYLERMLREALPERTVEVVNLGVVAISSDEVRVLVADVCRSYDADLIVIYSGNNEFLEMHADKYAAVHASFGTRVLERLKSSNAFRLLRRSTSGPQRPIAVADLALAGERISEESIIQDIEMAPGDRTWVLEAYEKNIEGMLVVAAEHNVPAMVMAVASNWRWRGRSDAPEGWLQELVGDSGAVTDDLRREGLKALTQALARTSDPIETYEALHRRGLLLDDLGLHEEALVAYRESMNADPHLRRALDEMGERVRSVAARHSAEFVDTVALLAGSAEHGIVGFDEFYDYVHFTPRAALMVAADLFDRIRASGWIEAPDFDPQGFLDDCLQDLVDRDRDYLESGLWLGFCFDRAMLVDRDLWKYDRMLAFLEDRLEDEPDDALAHAYLGNLLSFRAGQAAAAAQAYRRALDLRPDLEAVLANLKALENEYDL